MRSRFRLEGPGAEDRGVYTARALANYKLKVNGNEIAVWESRSRQPNGHRKKILPEAPLWQSERKLLRTSPKVNDYILEEQPSRSER